MPLFFSLLTPVSWAFLSALLTGLVIVSTQGLHGHLSHDGTRGVQKLHAVPTPRIGGLAVLTGAVIGGLWLRDAAASLWVWLLLAGAPAFLAGLTEDITKRVSVRARLGATILSGLVFLWGADVTLPAPGLPGIDLLWASPLLVLGLTALAMAGLANAVNLIDGFHGLAAGSALIAGLIFAALAGSVGDAALFTVALMVVAITAGFFLVNFPRGVLFFGDAGAYFTGFLLAALAVLLPARNPELPVLIGLLVLAYPLTETLFSILRRLAAGQGPGQADRAHLHHRVYDALPAGGLRNPVTGALLWGMSLGAAVPPRPRPQPPRPPPRAYLVFFSLYAGLYSLLGRG
jgi:UDP-N-acetylmuramyl pentapeptide phosphotransferase/UDP-N-acetylglucosamine-1-phosphate transferase